MSEELKPCPSCSGKPFIDLEGIRYYSIVCKECGLGTKFYCDASKQEACDSWNARATPTFTKEDVEKATEAILKLAYEKKHRKTVTMEHFQLNYPDMVKIAVNNAKAALSAIGKIEE